MVHEETAFAVKQAVAQFAQGRRDFKELYKRETTTPTPSATSSC